MKRVHRNLLIVAVAAGLLLLNPFVRVFATYPYKALREHFHRIPFDSAAWQDLRQVKSDDPVRLRMIGALMSSRRLEGLSRAEVNQLLGPHSDIEVLYMSDQFKNYDSVYWLGPRSAPMSFDDEWLAISFDERGKVRTYKVVTN